MALELSVGQVTTLGIEVGGLKRRRDEGTLLARSLAGKEGGVGRGMRREGRKRNPNIVPKMI